MVHVFEETNEPMVHASVVVILTLFLGDSWVSYVVCSVAGFQCV